MTIYLTEEDLKYRWDPWSMIKRFLHCWCEAGKKIDPIKSLIKWVFIGQIYLTFQYLHIIRREQLFAHKNGFFDLDNILHIWRTYGEGQRLETEADKRFTYFAARYLIRRRNFF